MPKGGGPLTIREIWTIEGRNMTKTTYVIGTEMEEIPILFEQWPVEKAPIVIVHTRQREDF